MDIRFATSAALTISGIIIAFGLCKIGDVSHSSDRYCWQSKLVHCGNRGKKNTIHHNLLKKLGIKRHERTSGGRGRRLGRPGNTPFPSTDTGRRQVRSTRLRVSANWEQANRSAWLWKNVSQLWFYWFGKSSYIQMILGLNRDEHQVKMPKNVWML